MKERFILNVIHRPEMVPEYEEKVTGHGKEENISRKALLTESLDIFKTQQAIAHKNGIKTTIQMTYASLFNDEAVALAKEHHAQYGDEIALSLLGLPCKEFRDKYKTKDFCIWMFSMEDKKAIVTDVFEKFHEKFGFYPESTGSYYLDADLINFIKETYPMVKCAVATCWEEGPKAYHTCNNSWYTLFDGGPWNPWIPSKQNTHAPAANAAEDSGIVAIPHLSRDLLACFDGNGSNFGTYPQNVLRGMIYKPGSFDEQGNYSGQEYPYLYNLIDQYRSLGKYNDGYSYNMMFVGPGWMNKMGRWEAPYELLLQSYEDGICPTEAGGQAGGYDHGGVRGLLPRRPHLYPAGVCPLAGHPLRFGQAVFLVCRSLHALLPGYEPGRRHDRSAALRGQTVLAGGHRHAPCAGCQLSLPDSGQLPGGLLYPLCRERHHQELQTDPQRRRGGPLPVPYMGAL